MAGHEENNGCRQKGAALCGTIRHLCVAMRADIYRKERCPESKGRDEQRLGQAEGKQLEALGVPGGHATQHWRHTRVQERRLPRCNPRTGAHSPRRLQLVPNLPRRQAQNSQPRGNHHRSVAADIHGGAHA